MSSSDLERALGALLAPEVADGEPCAAACYRFGAGDMSPEEAAAFRRHLELCPACRADLAALQALEQEAARDAPARGRWRALRFTAWAAAAAAVVLIAALWSLPGPTPEAGDAGFRVKGPVGFQVAVQRGAERFVAASGDGFATGDVLGFFYTAPEDLYLTVLFADQVGGVSRVFPAGAARRLPAGVERPLPDGAVLEPGRGCEWLAAFFSPGEPDAAMLEGWLRRAVRSHRPDCALDAVPPEGFSLRVVILRRDVP